MEVFSDPFRLLSHWRSAPGSYRWVLGTIFRTQGSAYRKAGAMMLFNDAGERQGLISGGCLEAELHRRAMQCLHDGLARTVTFDSTDEDDVSFRLGIGCGGVVEILLQPISETNQSLFISDLIDDVERNGLAEFWARIPDQGPATPQCQVKSGEAGTTQRLVKTDFGLWAVTPIRLPVHLVVFGGGVDAQPLAQLASQLGWTVSVVDPRPANGRREDFPSAQHLLNGRPVDFESVAWAARVDAAVVMNHNIDLDAEALRVARGLNLKYFALLGPEHRKATVLDAASIPSADATNWLAGPAGLSIGADTPETIALSVLAECQAKLTRTSGSSMSGYLDLPESDTDRDLVHSGKREWRLCD